MQFSWMYAEPIRDNCEHTVLTINLKQDDTCEENNS